MTKTFGVFLSVHSVCVYLSIYLCIYIFVQRFLPLQMVAATGQSEVA